MMHVWSVIPALNESSGIAAVVAGVRPHVQRVIVVDDGSSDETASRAEDAGAAVVRHPVNRGKGLALRTGLAAALAGPCTHVLLLDGDGQHLPTDIPRLLAAAADGADLVVGERMFNRDAMPVARYYSNVVGSWVLSRFIGTTVRDTQSGFRVVRMDALRRIHLSARGYEIETEMLIRLARSGARIVSVPVQAVYAAAPSKLRPVRDTTRTCFLAVKYRYLTRT
jgi:glycosyltransferase involved in cell wall biosynthesis